MEVNNKQPVLVHMESDNENPSPGRASRKRSRPIAAIEEEDSADSGRMFLSNAALAAAAASAMTENVPNEASNTEELKTEPELSAEQPSRKRLRLQRLAPRHDEVAEVAESGLEGAEFDPERARLEQEVKELNEESYRIERKEQEQNAEEKAEGTDEGLDIQEPVAAEDVDAGEWIHEEEPIAPEDTAAGEWANVEDDPDARGEQKHAGSHRRRNEAYFGAQGDANRRAAANEEGGPGALASLISALAGAAGGGGMNFMDPVRPCPLLSLESKNSEEEEKEAEARYKLYENTLRETKELQEDNATIEKDLAALEQVAHGTLAAYLMNRRHFDLNIPWKPDTWCFMCECGQNRQMWEKNRFYGQMIQIIEDGLATMEPDVLCRKVQMHYNKELRWTLRRKELRDMAWKKSMIWKHITKHAPTTRSMLEVERINISNIMDVLAQEGIQTIDPVTRRTSIDPMNTKLYLTLQAKRDKVVQQLVLLRTHNTF